VAVALAVLAGCGGGGGGGAATTSTTAAVTTLQTASASTGSLLNTTTSAQGATTLTETFSTRSSKEQQSGDETPVSTQALFTGRGGKITPAKVEVPPFIAVTLVLHSADRKIYSIQVNGRGIATNGRAQLKLPGLRAQDKYVIKVLQGTPARLVIEANAEPGP
jgi:hypothetical protein